MKYKLAMKCVAESTGICKSLKNQKWVALLIPSLLTNLWKHKLYPMMASMGTAIKQPRVFMYLILVQERISLDHYPPMQPFICQSNGRMSFPSLQPPLIYQISCSLLAMIQVPINYISKKMLLVFLGLLSYRKAIIRRMMRHYVLCKVASVLPPL